MWMRIIHTADWHIGQELHGFSRRFEHEAFLDWLHGQCVTLAPDALLIAGDVFHHANPTNDAIEIFARFTERVLQGMPALKIVAVAGNHDSPARFDALCPLVRAGVHLIGAVPRLGEAYDVARMIVEAGDGAILAVPYLRLSDLPRGALDDSPADKVREFYAACWAQAARILRGRPCVMTGHLHVAGGAECDSERPILVGGEHAVAADIFPAGASYVALGHLHCAQSFDGGRVQYSGSPLPLSATERGYQHQVVLLDIGTTGEVVASAVPVPRAVAHLRVPETGAVEPAHALAMLEWTADKLDLPRGLPVEQRPFVEVHLKLAAPAPMAASLLAQDLALSKLPLRLVKVEVHMTAVPAAAVGAACVTSRAPAPATLFAHAFAQAHNGQPPGEPHRSAFLAAWEGLDA
jgi:DNA repair protein SbcD/Mre11